MYTYDDIEEMKLHTFIFKNVKLGENVIIFPYSVIGRPPMAPVGVTSNRNKPSGSPVVIGDNSIIGANVVIYEDVVIGNNVLIGDGVRLRNGSKIGNNCVIGMNTKIGNRTVIGNGVKIMDLCNISGDMVIEDNVFIAQGVMCANDNTMGRDKNWQGGKGKYIGPIIKKFATIGMNSTLLPGIEIGQDSIVAAGSIVTKNVAPKTMVMGTPAKYYRDLYKEELRYE